MPSSSHTRCKVCRKITHARHRFGMCKQCSDKHQARLANQRRETQERRARRLQAALAIPVLEEDQPMPLEEKPPAPDKPGRRPSVTLTDAQQVEILDAYTTTSEPVQDICDRFGIKHTYIYNILDRVGVSWRRGNAESFLTWQENQARNAEGEAEQEAIDRSVVSIANEKIPEDTARALENMLKLPTPTVLPPKPEPVAPTPSVERRTHATEPLQTWRVQISGFLTIEATSIEEALFEAKRRGGPLVKITYMQLVDS